MIKDHGPKNPPAGCNLGWQFHPLSGHFLKRNQLSVLSIYIVVLELVMIADGLIKVCAVKIGKFGEQDSVQARTS